MPAHRLLTAVTLLAAAVVASSGCNKGGPPQTPDGGAPVVTVAHPILDKVTLYTDLTGNVAQKNSVEIRPRVSGYIKEVKFQEGKEVAKDQVLFVIDPTIYEALLKQSEGQVRNYQAQLDKAKADLARTQETYNKGATAKTELDQNVASVAVAEAQLFTARASVDQARQNREWTEVKSPIAGRTSTAKLTVGNLATQDQSLLTTVVGVDPMYAYFDVDESTVRMYQRLIAEKKLKSVNDGAKVVAEIKLKDEPGYPHKGFLEFVDNRLNPSTGSLTIRGEFPNPLVPGTDSRPLTAGFYCRGRIPIGNPYDGILIPDAAVGTDQGKKIVFVVGGDNRVEARPVVLGPLFRGLRLVEKGLTTSDRVVIKGLGRVQAGIMVEPHDGTIPKPSDTPDPAGDAGRTQSAEPAPAPKK